MTVFAVNYKYSDDLDAVGAIRPAHREWSAEQVNAGALLASGPLPDSNSALLIFESRSLEELIALLNTDPFDIAGLIDERAVQQWNPVFGPWSN
jgi:uncharacterized protein YciI